MIFTQFVTPCRLIPLLLLPLILNSCYQKRNEPVDLSVDFSSAAVWKYDFSCDIKGSFAWPDTASTLKSSLTCCLSSSREPGVSGRLSVAATKVAVTSDILDSNSIDNIVHQIESRTYPFRFNGSVPVPEDSAVPPMFGLGEWDLYRQLVKVAPVLPEGRIRPGYSWERERSMPLETSYGRSTCNLYQYFSFDSLFGGVDNRQFATVSWRFRYTVVLPTLSDSIEGTTDNLPRAGNGCGRAVIDIKKREFLSAEVEFVTPAASFRNINVRWEERIRLIRHVGGSGA